MLKEVLSNKKASETVEQLIVITIMGALAISAISAIAANIKSQNNQVLSSLQNNLNQASQNAGVNLGQ